MDYFDEVEKAIESTSVERMGQAASLLEKAGKFGQRVWIVGNGGSAATAMHLSNDLQKMCGLDVIALPSLVPTITAYGNDMGWDRMFSAAMKSFRVGDILVAISCSGNSANVVEAAKYALECDGKLIVLTGSGGILENMPGVIISIPHKDIKVVEDVHSVICHALTGMINEMQGV